MAGEGKRKWLDFLDETFQRLDQASKIYQSFRSEPGVNTERSELEKHCEEKHILETRLTRVSYGNRQEVIARMRPDDSIFLRRDYQNPHDSNAIGVYLTGNRQQFGWVPRELAKELATYMDTGDRLPVKIGRISEGKEGKYRGVTILITVPESFKLGGSGSQLKRAKEDPRMRKDRISSEKGKVKTPPRKTVNSHSYEDYKIAIENAGPVSGCYVEDFEDELS